MSERNNASIHIMAPAMDEMQMQLFHHLHDKDFSGYDSRCGDLLIILKGLMANKTEEMLQAVSSNP
jgi:hypothetical protein